MKRCLQQTLTKIKRHKQARQKNVAENLLFISFRDDGVYLNEVKIIDKRANLQIAVLKALLEKHLIGNLYSTPTGVNIIKIASILGAKGVSSFDLEKQIRQSIYRIKKNVSEKYADEVGEIFIQSSQAYGRYKLAKNVVLICP